MGKINQPTRSNTETLIVGIVGPCGAGKTTLVQLLKGIGITARHIAQEHSYVADMWEQMTDPDILIFLDASFELATRRRKLNWTLAEYQEQQHRLRDARQRAQLVIQTDTLSAIEVFEKAKQFIQIFHAQRS